MQKTINPLRLFAKKADKPVGHVKLGEMNTGLIYFITPSIILSILFMGSIIGFGHKTVIHFFVAGELALNSLIVGGLFFALGRIVANIMTMRDTALFLKNVEMVGAQETITDEDINRLKARLQTKGKIVNVKSMANVLDNMKQYGYLSFTDNDARFIKSKAGYRTSSNRGSAGFLAGLLIMMGLLGTYLGLLETIDAVGKAMAGMANIGGPAAGAAPAGDGGLSDDQMSNFIGSIAEPLQGMGLAFSASLFGIGGSLIVSYFNYLAGHTQNHFIENVSRWIDERIPSPGEKAKKMADNQKMPAADDLKAWLASFAYLSQKTHKKLGQLVVVMSQTVNTLSQQKQTTDAMGQRQADICTALEQLNSQVSEFKNQNSAIATRSEQHLKNVDRSLSSISTQTGTLKDTSQSLSNDIRSVLTAIENQGTDQTAVTTSIHSLKDSLASLSRTEKELATTLAAKTGTQDNSDVSNLVFQLNTLLEEMSKKNEDQFLSMFNDDEDKDKQKA